MAYYFNQLRDYAQNTFYTQNTKNKVAEFNAPLFVETDTNTSNRTEVNSQNYKEVQKNGVKSSVLRDYGERITMGTLISALNYANSVNREAKEKLIDVTLNIKDGDKGNLRSKYTLSDLYDKDGYPTKELQEILVRYNIKADTSPNLNATNAVRQSTTKNRPNITITDVNYGGNQGRISSITYNILGTIELLNDLSTE